MISPRMLLACLAVITLCPTLSHAVKDLDEPSPGKQQASSQQARSQQAAGKRSLLPVEWGNTNLSRAMAGAKSQAASNAAGKNPAARRLQAASSKLSLPRLGLGQSLSTFSPVERSRALSASTDSAAPAALSTWPTCAKLNSVKRLEADDGTWYTDTYDYGCIEVTVSGDRNIGRTAAPEVDKAEPDCLLGGSDEPGSDTLHSFNIETILFKIPYSISGTCLSVAADSFCRDRRAQCALITRLIFEGGSKENE